MTKSILPFYEREHANVSALTREFAEQYPQLAGALGFIDGECDDPHVQRIVEATVMLGARILQQLEDSYPQFTGALLDVNYPHYTQPFPSTSIVRFDCGRELAQTLPTAVKIPRGSLMSSAEHQGNICHFQNTYEVDIAPVVISEAAFASTTCVPPSVRLPEQASGVIRIVVEGVNPTLPMDKWGVTFLRVFIDGEASLRATLRDLLFMNVTGAWVEADNASAWMPLDTPPIAAVGFRDSEAMVPSRATSHPAYRLLTEYFACPEKFNFFDIDLRAIGAKLPADAQRFALHLAVDGASSNSDRARILKPLSSKNMLLSCTPVVNLFRRAASPIDLTHAKSEYPLLASAERPAAFDIHHVESVHVVRETANGTATTEFFPYYSMRHGLAGGRKGHYYAHRRDDILAITKPGYENQISFVDIDFDPMALETATVSVVLSCTNRDLPRAISMGQAGGDLKLEKVPGAYPIRFLRKPSETYRFPAGAHWRLVAHLSLNHHSLANEDRAAFTEMLMLYDTRQSSVSQRHIRGIVGLAQSSARAWMPDAHGGARVHGTEVCLTLDEEAFTGGGLHAFVQVIDHFLGLYAHMNTFTQLVVISNATQKELIRCQPRSGAHTLV